MPGTDIRTPRKGFIAMSINDITLAGGMRQNLTSLQVSAALQARTTERLAYRPPRQQRRSTTRRPTSPPQNHRGRANDLAARKDTMGEAIQTVKAADEGIEGITALIQQAKGLAASARSAGRRGRARPVHAVRRLCSPDRRAGRRLGLPGHEPARLRHADGRVQRGRLLSLDITGFDASLERAGSIAAAANAGPRMPTSTPP